MVYLSKCTLAQHAMVTVPGIVLSRSNPMKCIASKEMTCPARPLQHTKLYLKRLCVQGNESLYNQASWIASWVQLVQSILATVPQAAGKLLIDLINEPDGCTSLLPYNYKILGDPVLIIAVESCQLLYCMQQSLLLEQGGWQSARNSHQ